MKELFFIHRHREPTVTREALPSILGDIAKRREIKGKADDLIPYIQKVRKQAEILGDVTSVVKLYQEEFLCGQHIVMEEESKDKYAKNQFDILRGKVIMESTSMIMAKYLGECSEDEKNKLNLKDLDPTVRAKIYRYQGKYAEISGEYYQAEKYYWKGHDYFSNPSTPEKERFNILEFDGFISYSILKQGDKFDEGIKETQNTLNKFEESKGGKLLKEKDYYTWAVWKSGIEIRTAEHILKNKIGKYENLAKDFLIDAKSILRMPNGDTKIFELRLDELKAAKNELGIFLPGDVLKLKRKCQKSFKKKFFEPQPSSVTVAINEICELNGVRHYRTTDSLSSRGKIKGLHTEAHLRNNFQL